MRDSGSDSCVDKPRDSIGRDFSVSFRDGGGGGGGGGGKIPTSESKYPQDFSVGELGL